MLKVAAIVRVRIRRGIVRIQVRKAGVPAVTPIAAKTDYFQSLILFISKGEDPSCVARLRNSPLTGETKVAAIVRGRSRRGIVRIQGRKAGGPAGTPIAAKTDSAIDISGDKCSLVSKVR